MSAKCVLNHRIDPDHDSKVVELSHLPKVGEKLKHLCDLYNVKPERDEYAESVKLIEPQHLLSTLHVVVNNTIDFPVWRAMVNRHLSLLHEETAAVNELSQPWRDATMHVIDLIEKGPSEEYNLTILYEARYILYAKNWTLFQRHKLIDEAMTKLEAIEDLGFKIHAMKNVQSIHSDIMKREKKNFKDASRAYTAVIGEVVLQPSR